jgi:uncharacterized protein YggU (UPF0235/DUF167 family)
MYIKVRVTAEARKESVEIVSETHFNISVKEPPLQNLANKRVIELVAMHFHALPKQVRIINGHHSPSKILSVDI